MKCHSLRTSLSLSRASLIEKKKLLNFKNKNKFKHQICKLQIFQLTLPEDVTCLFPLKLILTDLKRVLIL